MLRALPLLILLGFVLELASLIWAGSQFGVLTTLLLLAAGVIAGMTLIRGSSLGLAATLRQNGMRGQFKTSEAGMAFLRVGAGFLFIVPGFVSDAVALLLLLPPVSRRVVGLFATQVNMEFRSTGSPHPSGGPIIDGEAVELAGEVSGPEKLRD